MTSITEYLYNNICTPTYSYDIEPEDFKNKIYIESILSHILMMIKITYKIKTTDCNIYYSDYKDKYYFYILNILFKICYYEFLCGTKHVYGRRVIIEPQDLRKLKIKND